MSYLADALSVKVTPQSEAIPDSTQVPNSAGGFAFPVDDWTRLDRFLILGTEGGSYYAGERKLTADNAGVVIRCIALDGVRTVARIAEISDGGRAPKNDPAILALALCLTRGDIITKRAAAAAVPKVCRIGTHLFQLVGHIDSWGKWNRTTRRAVAGWYTERDAASLAYQTVKYQARNGWSHHDVMHQAHPRFASGQHQAIAHWAKKGWDEVGDQPHPDEALRQVWAFERAKRAATAGEIARLITDHDLPREAVPTQFLNDVAVWDALLRAGRGMPITALVRNLAKMTAVGLIAPNSAGAAEIVRRLGDVDGLKRGRVHPIALLAALGVYGQGHGERGSLTWTPVQGVVDALDAAFYTAFQAVEPTGKRHLLALDVSGSMDGGCLAGIPSLTPRIGSAAMALVTAAVEPAHEIVAFSAGPAGPVTIGNFRSQGFHNALVPVPISPRQRLDDVVRLVSAIPMGGTDCALPMLWAIQQKREVDVFVVYTDSETWAGAIHPVQALRAYREKMGIAAKLVVVGMVANEFSIADPDDAGMLDVVGFDTAAPAVMSDFARA